MTIKKRYIATLDIETLDGLKGKEFGLGCFYTIQKKKECFLIERDSDLFFKKIFEFSKKHKVLCFIQNQDFDIRFLLKYCIDKLNIYPFVIQSNSSILEVRIDEFNIIFRDSLQFLLCGQAKAEQTFLNKQIKKEVDFDKVLKQLNDKRISEKTRSLLWKELEERVKSDVVGLYQVMFKYKELMHENFNLDVFRFVTLPSFAIRAFAKRLREDTKHNLIHLNPYITFQNFAYQWENETKKHLYFWTRESYFGGRCEVFNLDYLKKIYYYDFNSLYPSVCITKKYPNPNKYFILEFPTNKFFIDKIKGKYQYIIEAKISENIDYPILPLRDKQSVKFVNGEKIGVWVSPIFERFLEFKENIIIEIIKIRVYEESGEYFKNFMTDRYYNRVEYKKKDETSKAEVEKLVMNSLTGKPAQKPIRESWVLYNPEMYETMMYENQPFEIIEFTDKYKLMKIITEVLKDFQIIEWTSFITGYAQEHLHRTIYKLKKQNIDVYYCDTDCLFTSQPLEKNIELITDIGLDVMQLKNELIDYSKYTLNRTNGNYTDKKTLEEIQPPYFDEVKFYLPKVYILKRKDKFQVVAKGISLFMLYETLGIPLNKNSDSKELFNKKIDSFEQAEYLLFNTGVYTNRYLKYKSSLRQNKDILSFGRIEKTVKKIYDKRKINKDLTTKPLNSPELEDLKQIRTENLNTLLSNVKTSYVTYSVNHSKRNKKIK
jgi:hypothetical protein